MKILAVIPARGGSKGLPKKNIKVLGNKPLITWSIKAAKASRLVHKTMVTSDDETIISISKAAGAEIPFVRPDHLASDTASSKDVLIHTIDHYKSQGEQYDYIVLLQPTSPFRKADDIDKAIELAKSTNADMVVSVKETASNPYYVLFEENEKGHLENSKKGHFTRRQDCPTVYEYNGSIYVIKVSALYRENSLTFEKTVKYIMDDFHSVDIDTQIDFDFAELLLNKGVID